MFAAAAAVRTTPGVDWTVGVVKRVFAVRNLFGDNTCCGALATY